MLKQSKYFRVSLTEKCNFDCDFCHNEGSAKNSNKRLLKDDFKFICNVAQEEGFTKVKLTGGEPTLRKDIGQIIEELSELNIEDLSMITNGTLLERKILELKKSGLKRINVTLNTLDKNRFSRIAKCSKEKLQEVINGIDKAIDAGYKDIKINFVYLGKESDTDLNDLIEFVRERELTLVVLPVMKINGKTITLNELYGKLKMIGIKSEKKITDKEGIQKSIVELINSAKVLIRLDELSDYKPYIFCDVCSTQKNCREGIFPLRLSASGVLIPCIASKENRISVFDEIKNRDREGIKKKIMQIKGWRKNGIQK